MVSSPSWLPSLAEKLGLGPLEIVGGGAIGGSSAGGVWHLSGSDGDLAVKVGDPSAVSDEAQGLRQLAGVAGGPAVPSVIHCEEGMLVTTWVAGGTRSGSSQHEEELGRRLATLHRSEWAEWGGGSSWIGNCRVDPSPAPSAAEFYARRLGGLARTCGLDPEVDRVTARLESLIPDGAPALLHGDLWWGNVMFSPAGPVLIDPSVHGGHPEEDLAMLALFGSVPDRLLAAYSEARPLDPGWRDRVELWQLYPLLVHTVLFGGSYRSQAESAARRYG